jgi:hypothetical protein
MSIPRLLDHVVIAGPDLDEVIRWFAALTGVQARPGGAHPTGTANALVALTIDGARGPQYIELIGPDPDRADAALPTVFGIDGLGGPRVQAYAVHPDDIDGTVRRAREHGFDPGDVTDLSRRTPDGGLLEWRLTRSEHERLDVPFLIDWGGTPHPGLSDIPAIELVSLVRVEPDPQPLTETLGALGLGDGVASVEPSNGVASVEPSDGVADAEQSADAGYRLVLRRADGGLVVVTSIPAAQAAER